MAVAARSSGSGYTVVSSLATGSVTRPAGITAGDVIIGYWGTNSGYSATPNETGWIALGPRLQGTQSALQAWVRVAGVSEPATYTWALTAQSYGTVGVSAYSGVAALSPIGALASQSNASSTTVAWPAVTSPNATGMLVLLGGLYGTASVTVPPSGYTNRGGVGRGVIYDKTVGSGSTGTPTETLDTAIDSQVLTIHLTATAVAPIFAQNPVISGNNWNGQPLSESTPYALGAESLSYVWKRDGVTI